MTRIHVVFYVYCLVLSFPVVPSAPRLTVRLFNETSAEVFWTPQHSSDPLLEILGFRLTYALKNHSRSESVHLSPEEREYVVSGLRPGAAYSFLLAARGRSGYGEEAREDLAVPEIPAVEFPELSERIDTTCCSLWFSWIPPTPSDRNGEVTRYALVYGESGDGEPQTLLLPLNSSSYTVHGLNPDRAYAVRMCAHDSAGSGPCGPQVLYRTAAFDTGTALNEGQTNPKASTNTTSTLNYPSTQPAPVEIVPHTAVTQVKDHAEVHVCEVSGQLSVSLVELSQVGSSEERSASWSGWVFSPPVFLHRPSRLCFPTLSRPVCGVAQLQRSLFVCLCA